MKADLKNLVLGFTVLATASLAQAEKALVVCEDLVADMLKNSRTLTISPNYVDLRVSIDPGSVQKDADDFIVSAEGIGAAQGKSSLPVQFTEKEANGDYYCEIALGQDKFKISYDSLGASNYRVYATDINTGSTQAAGTITK